MESFPSSPASEPRAEEGALPLPLWIRAGRLLPWLVGAGLVTWLSYHWFVPLPLTYVAIGAVVLILLFGVWGSRRPWNMIILLGLAVSMGLLWRAEMFVVAQTFRWALALSLGTLVIAVLGKRWLLSRPWRWLLALAGVGYLAIWAWFLFPSMGSLTGREWWAASLGGGMVTFWGLLMTTTWTEFLYQPKENPLALAGDFFIEFWALIWTLPLVLNILY